jgi:hypothetical protein
MLNSGGKNITPPFKLNGRSLTGVDFASVYFDLIFIGFWN